MKKCGICPNIHTDDMLETHHQVPRHLKGSDNPNNLIDICPNCHTATHDVARLLKKNRDAAVAYLEGNYRGNPKAQAIIIALAKVILKEEEHVKTKENVKLPLTLPINVHRKLSDMSKQAKCSMHNFIINLIEASYNMKHNHRGNFNLKRLK